MSGAVGGCLDRGQHRVVGGERVAHGKDSPAGAVGEFGLATSRCLEHPA